MIRIFNVEGKPHGKARPRATKNGHVFNPKENIEYETKIKEAYKEIYGKEPLMKGPVSVHIYANFPIPKSAIRKTKPNKIHIGQPYLGKPDNDNICKSILDALNGIAYADDKQVWSTSVISTYREKGNVLISLIMEDE